MKTNYQKYKKYYKERIISLKKNGLCISCGVEKAEKDRVRCIKCLNKQREYDRNRYNWLSQHNLCVLCGKNTPKDGKKWCEQCLIKYKRKNNVV